MHDCIDDYNYYTVKFTESLKFLSACINQCPFQYENGVENTWLNYSDLHP